MNLWRPDKRPEETRGEERVAVIEEERGKGSVWTTTPSSSSSSSSSPPPSSSPTYTRSFSSRTWHLIG
ncbi:hypothetical protein INR49_006345 [Caranx melampygus]|nr:hypothetical protein INR49_006345 [Caranx melampygus]